MFCMEQMERLEPWVGQEQLMVCIMAKVLRVLLACLASLEVPCMPELILPPMALPLTVHLALTTCPVPQMVNMGKCEHNIFNMDNTGKCMGK